MKRKEFLSFDGINIPYLEFKHDENIKRKNIVFFHDSSDSIENYEEFGESFFEKGYNVYILEYRGHGELKENDILSFGNGKIEDVLRDANLFIFKNFKNVSHNDVILFGQGLGSLIAYYISIGTSFKNIILSSILLDSGLSVNFSLLITAIEKKLNIKESYLNRYFKAADKKFLKEGKLAYLTRDKNIREKLNSDKNYTEKLSPNAFSDIYRLMRYVKKNFNKIRKASNILCIYGTDDNFLLAERVKKYMININKNGRNIKIIKNKSGRHNSIFEINRKEIYNEIDKFIKNLK